MGSKRFLNSPDSNPRTAANARRSLAKPQSKRALPQPLPARLKWLFATTAMLITIGGCVWWANGQTKSAAAMNPIVQQEIADLQISDPVGFAAEMEKNMTPEDLRIRELCHLGITNSAAYFALFPKTEAQLESEAAAIEAITHPITIDQALALATPTEREQMLKAMDSILHPPTTTPASE